MLVKVRSRHSAGLSQPRGYRAQDDVYSQPKNSSEAGRSRPDADGLVVQETILSRSRTDHHIDKVLANHWHFVKVFAYPNTDRWRAILSAVLLAGTFSICSFSRERVPYNGRTLWLTMDLGFTVRIRQGGLKRAIGSRELPLLAADHPISTRLQQLLDYLVNAVG